jgi:alpha-tubulin suppressor-like RCC1 family protein
MAVIINSGWTLGNGWYAAGFNQYQLNVWGNNSFGQLGLSDVTNRSSPVQVGTTNLWSNIALGQAHTIAIQSPGTLWTWGSNSFGQLGANTLVSYQTSSPVQIQASILPLIAQWSSVVGGMNQGHETAIQSNGTLWSWGNNSYGALGNNSQTNRSSPGQVGTLSTWTQIANGTGNAYAIQSPGTLWAWGRNDFGSLGLNTSTSPILSPVQVGSLSNWAQIFNSWASVAGILSNGSLYTWGFNTTGQLGLGDTAIKSSTNRSHSASCSMEKSCFKSKQLIY